MNEETDIEDWAPAFVVIITLLGGFLRVLLIGTKGMWLDETFSVWLAKQSIPDLLQWTAKIDPHPPFYYLLLHYWAAYFGDTPYYVRLLSAFFGTFTIPVVYLIGKRTSGAAVGLIAALFLALSPFNIYFSQETRMYTVLTFNAAMAIYALSKLLTDPRSIMPMGRQFQDYLHIWRTSSSVETDIKEDFSYKSKVRPQTGWRGWLARHRWGAIQSIETDLTWLVFIIFSAGMLLTHNTAVFFPIATNIFVLSLMSFQRANKTWSQTALQAPSLGNWLKAQIGILILWSPWIPASIQQIRRVNQEFWLPSPDWNTVTQTLRALLNASAQNQIGQVMTWSLCATLCLGLIYYRKKLSIFLFWAALFMIPVLGELLVSLHRPIFYGRTLIWITVPMVMVLGAGVAQLRFRPLIVIVLGILSANYLFSGGDYYRFVQKEDWYTAAGYVANFAQKDDLVLFNSNFVVIPFNYYFKPFEEKYLIQVEKRGIPMDLFNDEVLEPKMKESDIPTLIALLHGHDRVWLVYSHSDYTDPMGLIPKTLASQMKLIRTRDFFGGQVQLYGTP